MKYTTFLKSAPKILVCALACLISISRGVMPAVAPGLASSTQGIPSMDFSEKELEGLYNYLQNLDDKELEEIERLTKQTLADMGFDPDTLQPLEGAFKQPLAPQQEKQPLLPEKPEAKPQEKVIEPPKNIVREIPGLLDSLIAKLGSIRLKTSLGPWLADTNNLIRSLLIINKPEHHKRIAAPEYDKLRLALEKLNRSLQTYEPQLTISIQKPALWEDPYEALGLLPSANQKQVDEAYAKIKEFQNPQTIRQQLAQANWSPTEIDKAVKEAQISLDFINDAYEKIKDPQSRAIVNLELEALQAAEQATSQSANQARQAIIGSLSDAIYQDQILNSLEHFLKKYEPEELAQRQQMDKAEAERLKEHQASMSPKPYGGKTLHIRGTQPRQDFRMPWETPSFGGSGRPSFRPSGGGPSESPRPSQPGGKDKSKPGGGGGGAKAGKGKEKDKDKDDEKKTDEEKAKEKGEVGSKYKTPGTGKDKGTEKDKEKDEDKFDAVAQQLLDLDQGFFNFNENFDKPFFKDLQEKPLAVDQLAPNLNKFDQSTQIGDLSQKLTYIQKNLEKADDRKKKQYKSMWKGIEKNTKEFEKNLETAQKGLEPYQVSEEEKPEAKGKQKPQINLDVPDGQSVAKISSSVKQATQAMEKIESLVGEKKKKPELFPGLAPRR